MSADTPKGGAPLGKITAWVTGITALIAALIGLYKVVWPLMQPKPVVAVIASSSAPKTDQSAVSSAVPTQVPAPAPRKVMLGSCVGKGGLEGVRLWGPPAAYCNGVVGWGKYDAQVRAVSALASCTGKGGPNGVLLYGPTGEACGGMPNGAWGTYENPVDISEVGMAGCFGKGAILGGHMLWGPAGRDCGGISSWGPYEQYTVKPEVSG